MFDAAGIAFGITCGALAGIAVLRVIAIVIGWDIEN